jgi:hypothetical protein
MNKRIVMFGTGGISHLLGSHCRKDVEIVAYLNTVDRDVDKINEIPVIGMKELKNVIYDYIVVAFNDVRKGIDLLKSGGSGRKDCWVFV